MDAIRRSGYEYLDRLTIDGCGRRKGRAINWFVCLTRDDDAGAVFHKSYINNIDPFLTEVYKTLELVLARFIPLFELVLTDLHRSNPLRQRILGTYHYRVWD